MYSVSYTQAKIVMKHEKWSLSFMLNQVKGQKPETSYRWKFKLKYLWIMLKIMNPKCENWSLSVMLNMKNDLFLSFLTNLKATSQKQATPSLRPKARDRLKVEIRSWFWLFGNTMCLSTNANAFTKSVPSDPISGYSSEFWSTWGPIFGQFHIFESVMVKIVVRSTLVNHTSFFR